MQSVKRAILYPIIAWWVWMGLIMGAYSLLSNEIITVAAYASIQTALSAILTIAFTILYLRKVKQSSWREGLALGLTATAVVVIFDIGHNLTMSVDMAPYFTNTLPFYIVIPVITTAIMGCLKYGRTETSCCS